MSVACAESNVTAPATAGVEPLASGWEGRGTEVDDEAREGPTLADGGKTHSTPLVAQR